MSQMPAPHERRILKIGRYELLVSRHPGDRFGESLVTFQKHPRKRHLRIVRTDRD